MVCITRSQRDALRNEVLTSLTGVGDIYMLLNQNDWLGAMEHRERFDRDFQMLDQLGWHPEDEQDTYTLDMAPHHLAAFASHYLARIDGCLADGAQTLLHGDLIPTDPGDLPEEEARQQVRDRIDLDLEIRTVCKSILDALELEGSAA